MTSGNARQLHRRRKQRSPFAVYAVGVAVSLPFAGRSSDHLGRRPIMLVAVAVEVLAAAVVATTPTRVLAARLISGVGIGLATAAATAYLVELGVASRSGASAERAYVVSTFVTMSGYAFATLSSGLLSQYAPHPLVILTSHSQRHWSSAGLPTVAKHRAWKGDVIVAGMSRSTIGTLVDWCPGYRYLVHLPDRHGAEQLHLTCRESGRLCLRPPVRIGRG